MLIDALTRDMKNADDIACQMGEHLQDDPKATILERCVWALAVGQLHIIQWILRRDEHDNIHR